MKRTLLAATAAVLSLSGLAAHAADYDLVESGPGSVTYASPGQPSLTCRGTVLVKFSSNSSGWHYLEEWLPTNAYTDYDPLGCALALPTTIDAGSDSVSESTTLCDPTDVVWPAVQGSSFILSPSPTSISHTSSPLVYSLKGTGSCAGITATDLVKLTISGGVISKLAHTLTFSRSGPVTVNAAATLSPLT